MYSFNKEFDDHVLDILCSIRLLGLTVPQKSSIRGALKSSEQTKLFCHNQVKLMPGKENAAFDALGYQTKEGMLAISLEREFKYYTPLELSWSALNSIVFVFKLEKLFTHSVPNQQLVTSMDDIMTVALPNSKVEDGLFHEVRQVNGSVDIKNILAVMVPYHLVSLVKEKFSDVKIIPISATKKTVTDDPIEVFCKSKSVLNERIVCPNYANGLRMFRREFPTLNQFGVHLTRLPQYYPISGLANPLSIFLKNYNVTYMKSLRLSGLKPDQWVLLKNDTRFFIFSDRPENIHRVYCYNEDYPYLEWIVTKFDGLSKAAKQCQQFIRLKLVSNFFKPKFESQRGYKKTLKALAEKGLYR